MYTVVTHDGKFHGDDIFGVAALQLRFGVENLTVVRTRDAARIAEADIVLDVGGEYDPARRRFDHHQNGAPVRENGIPYAAFGLVWKEFGAAITGSDTIATKIEKKLAQPIDAADNGVSLYTVNEQGVAPALLTDVFESLMPPIGSLGNPDEAFLKAVEMAKDYLERVIERAKAKEVLRAQAQSVYEAATDKSILLFDAPMKRDLFVEYGDVNVIVFPDDSREKWVATVVPAGEETFASRVYFPESWAGLREDELVRVSGIEGAIFCHKTRFLFIAKSREGVERAAREAK